MRIPQRSQYVLLLSASLLFGCEQSDWFGKKTAQTQPPKQKAEPDFADAKEAPLPRISPSTLVAAGQMLERQNDVLGAIAQYEKAVVADPKQVVAYNRLGVLYQRLSRFDDAEDMFKRGIQANPGSAMLRNNFGFALLQRQRHSEAMEQFHAALEVSPDFRRARMNLAITLTKMKRFNDAINEFAKVLPREMAYYNVAVVCADMHDYINAEISLRKALDVNPKCKPVLAQFDRISALARTSRQQSEMPQMPQTASTQTQTQTQAQATTETPPAPEPETPTQVATDAPEAPVGGMDDPVAGTGVEGDDPTNPTNVP